MANDERARWTRLVADYEASELTQREFAQERGLSVHTLRSWIYRLRREPRPLVDATRTTQDATPSELRLVPVEVVASAPYGAEQGAGVATVELVLPSGARLRFPIGTDPAYVRALAGAL